MKQPNTWQEIEFRDRQQSEYIRAKHFLQYLKTYMASSSYEEMDPIQQEWVREQIVAEEKRLQFLTAWVVHYGASVKLPG